jgi:hypothetical protein
LPVIDAPRPVGRRPVNSELGRRRARFAFLMKRIQAAVEADACRAEGELTFTPEEWLELAGVFLAAAQAAAREQAA